MNNSPDEEELKELKLPPRLRERNVNRNVYDSDLLELLGSACCSLFFIFFHQNRFLHECVRNILP